MKNIFEQLTDLLKKDERLRSQDNQLLKNQAQELARKNDAELIKLLLSDKAIKKHFFFNVSEVLIFDKEKFIRFVSNKQFLPDSYTAFKNKIGLEMGDSYLSENKEAVLVWPYKDCVLEGGMTKEDQKRDEIFYNETLAPDDITRLLDPKVFTNFKRIDKTGEHLLCHSRESGNPGFRRDAQGTIKDNLIIKGNNLLALASLKKEFAGKVKLIYIDPPYNTGNDGFKYNDSFNHSSWLVFMKNRLEVAKQLLKDDGVIFINIDENEHAYLKILMDEVFDRKNFITNFLWKKKGTSTNVKGVQISQQCDFILCYGKTNYSKIIPRIKTSNERIYSNKDAEGNYRIVIIEKRDTGEYKRDSMKFPILGIKPREGKRWQIGREKAKELEKKGRFIDDDGIIKLKIYDFEDLESESAQPTLLDDHGTTSQANKELLDLLNGEIEFENPKPEKLLQHIIELSTVQDDLILDFFAGSGTSGAVAHKMKRQYILIEQMDYIHDLPEARLKKVISGEQGGISKAVNWQGGGDFVYMELMEWNEKWVKKIRDAEKPQELVKIWNDLKDNTFLSWRIDLKIFDANAADFAALSIGNQKKFLIECLDKNNLYVNLSEIEDKEYGISNEDMELNREFYK